MRVMISAGGTGGHLYPALAVAEKLRATVKCDVLWVGTRRGLESRVIPEAGLPFVPVWISGIHRRQMLRNLLFPLRMTVSFIQALSLIIKFRPHVILGCGAYVSWPVLAAGSVAGKKIVIMEQNSIPGLVVKVMAPGADIVFLSYKESKRFFKKQSNLMISGNPTRGKVDRVSREEGLSKFSLNPLKKTLFVFGGSQGSRVINESIADILDPLMRETELQILWAAGPSNYKGLLTVIQPYVKNIRLFPYITRMAEAYAASDLIVCRAGATTLAEIAMLKKAAIFIPLSTAAAGHQEKNARVMKEAEAAELVLESEIESGRLITAIQKLMADEGLRKKISEKVAEFAAPKAADIIVKELIELTKQSREKR